MENLKYTLLVAKIKGMRDGNQAYLNSAIGDADETIQEAKTTIKVLNRLLSDAEKLDNEHGAS